MDDQASRHCESALMTACDTTTEDIGSGHRIEIIRYNDTDTLGHVTSLAFINYCESARILFLKEAGQPIDGEDKRWMLVRMEVDFEAQLHFPGEVHVKTRVARIGNTSITTVQELNSLGKRAATLKAALVLVDRTSNKPVRVPDALRDRLVELGIEN